MISLLNSLKEKYDVVLAVSFAIGRSFNLQDGVVLEGKRCFHS
jgi:hypothetical protein